MPSVYRKIATGEVSFSKKLAMEEDNCRPFEFVLEQTCGWGILGESPGSPGRSCEDAIVAGFSHKSFQA